jgi:hydrogenase maturation protein HypF
MAVSYLYRIYGKDLFDLPVAPVLKAAEDKLKAVVTSIEKGIHAPLTSSTGRLFDAVSSLLGICQTHTFEAEGAMRLEACVDNSVKEIYNFDITGCVGTGGIISGVVNDLLNGESKPSIAAKFHNTVVRIIHDMAVIIRKETGIDKVILSGGTFQNRYLLSETEKMLIQNNFTVYSHTKVPSNDGGIALGQLAVAAKRRELACV